MARIDDLLSVAISLDIDPDANRAVKGRYDALSSPIEYGKVCVDACKKGLQKIIELLDTYDLEASLFYEARTAQMLVSDGINLPELSKKHEVSCHSLRHEDFLGKVSGIPMEEGVIEETIKKAKEILEKMFDCDIKGFRAPYTRINGAVVKVLERLGFQYDSSETITMGTEWAGNPFPLKVFNSNLLELALPSFYDANGKKMSSYLWAIFEGRRVAGEYIDAVLRARDIAKSGLFIFSVHPWHLYVDSWGNPFGMEWVKKNLENIEYILSQLKQMRGIRILRQDRYMENWLVSVHK